jgi:hypothetical protein
MVDQGGELLRIIGGGGQSWIEVREHRVQDHSHIDRRQVRGRLVNAGGGHPQVMQHEHPQDVRGAHRHERGDHERQSESREGPSVESEIPPSDPASAYVERSRVPPAGDEIRGGGRQEKGRDPARVQDIDDRNTEHRAP